MKFSYYKAESISEAATKLEELAGKGKIIAGGTDLLIGINNGKYAPEAIVDITYLDELCQMGGQNGNGLMVGAAVTHGDICRSYKNLEPYPALLEACSQLGSPQVRNLATVGGNICNAAPSAETAPALIALKSKVRIAGSSGEREMLLEDFFKGPSQTDLKHDEILMGVVLEKPSVGSGNAYFRLSPRNALDIAIVNVGAYVKLKSDFIIEDVRLCIGAVAPTPVRATSAEKALLGEAFNEKLAREIGKLAKTHAIPITDVRASAEYRKEMVGVLVERALSEAYTRAKSNF